MAMFERMQKPFLTIETGEAYQPIRLTYEISQKAALIEILNNLKCCEKTSNPLVFNFFWRDECDDLHFESLDTYKKNTQYPIRLGMLTIREQTLFLNLPSFKRACITAPFFHRVIDSSIAKITKADFINKVFGVGERLPHGFAELFKEEELDKIVRQRDEDYESVQARVEAAETAEEAFAILAEYTKAETQKRLPYAERYDFTGFKNEDAEITFLGFYIFLRGRELVAIRRWLGETGYTLSDAADETINAVFGDLQIGDSE